MNKWVGIGRLTADPTCYPADGDKKARATYVLACDAGRNQQADFIYCTCFGKSAEFTEKYLHKGIKVAVEGSIKTGSYTNKEGQRINTWSVFVSNHEFCESKSATTETTNEAGFESIPEGTDDELPFG